MLQAPPELGVQPPCARRPRERCPDPAGTPKPEPPGPRGGRQSSEPPLAEAATGLTLFPQLVSTQGRGAPRRGPRSPQACKEGRCGAPSSARGIGSFPDKGLRGSPAAFLGTRTAEPERPSPGAASRLQSAARSGAGDEPSATYPRPAHLPGRPRPAPLPGFSPASAEEVAEESVRTLGSLCERPRDTRQPLPSSDAAMGLAGAGASWWNQSIRGGQGHRRGGWRGRLFKKENQKGKGKGRSLGTTPGWLQGGETMASRLQAGASRRAASLCYLFVFIPILRSIFQEKKKLNQEIKTFSCQCLLRAWGRG